MSDNETKETQVAEETQNTVATESNNEDRKGRRGQRGEGRRGERRNRREENHGDELLDRVVTINRVSKTHKGGRTSYFQVRRAGCSRRRQRHRGGRLRQVP